MATTRRVKEQRQALAEAAKFAGSDGVVNVYGPPDGAIVANSRLCSSPALGQRIIFHVEARALPGVLNFACAHCGASTEGAPDDLS